MADIFISYARHDRERIEALAAALADSGHGVWWDRQILGGDDFSANIERELQAAGVVIVAWSESSARSHWVKDEAQFAAGEGKLVALSLDGTLPPMGFRQFHSIDLSDWPRESYAFNHLERAIASRLGAEESAAAPAATSGPPSAPPEDRQAPWIAVTPIKVRGDDAELIDLAEDLADSIASGLARFSHLKVAGKDSAAAGRRAGARYVLEGTVRKAGASLRLSVRLSSAEGGRQVWGENYTRAFEADAIFDLHDDLTDHVVASVADPYGALMRDLARQVTVKKAQEMTPYEAILRHFIYRQRISAADHLETRTALERAVDMAPGDANIRAALAAAYTEEYKHGYNPLPDPLDRALAAARYATDLEPDNAFANFALAEVHFFRQEVGAFRAAAERAIALNPRDSDAMAMIGVMTAYTGDWERGLELSARAMALNPNHPGWYRFAAFFDLYRQSRFEEALYVVERINLPDYFPHAYCRAMTHAQLGQPEEATRALQDLIALWPNVSLAALRELAMERWMYAQPELVELAVDGLRKAGMK